MFSRLISVPVLLGAAVGVPYVATNGTNVEGLFGGSGKNSSGTQLEAPAVLSKQQPLTGAAGHGSTIHPTQTPLEGLPTLSLYEVFDMNVSKEWVFQRWPRKSTSLSELGLFGIRVPLVTGTQLHDLAGSLTYLFGADGRVSRISFHGTTGDPTRVAMLATQQYRLQPQPAPSVGEQLFQIRHESQVFSELRVRPAAVLWANSPHDSYAVDMELQRPGVTTPLPSRLPPLPPVNAASQAAANKQIAAQNPAAATKPASTSGASDPSENWNSYFPRSRVPAKQVDGLESRGRMW